MQELTNPWTHFMRSTTGGGRALLADFQRAHPNEEFAGIPANRIAASDPAQLERFVRANGFGNQPNEFPSAAIEGRGLFGGILGGGGRGNGTAPAAWTRLYDNFVRGEAIAPPFHQVKVTDPTKLQRMTQAYLDLGSGRLKIEDFPDTRDVLLDSGMRDMGFMVKADLSAEQILVQACAQCHNSKLNQTISRAKFDINLSKMDREEKDKAIERLRLGDHDVKKMPPVRFRVLTEDEIQKLEALLRK
jgi:cytochrome c553